MFEYRDHVWKMQEHNNHSPLLLLKLLFFLTTSYLGHMAGPDSLAQWMLEHNPADRQPNGGGT